MAEFWDGIGRKEGGRPLAVWRTVTGLMLAALALPAGAYYRGDEYKLRDFRIDAEYFVDQDPLLPTWEERELSRNEPRIYRASAGSYTSKDLFSMHDLRLQQRIPDDFYFRFQYEADQDYDGIYERFQVGLAYALSPQVAFEVFGQPTARKQYGDIGYGLIYTRPGMRWRTDLILPNFKFDEKNKENGYYLKTPLAGRLDGALAWTPEWEVFTSTTVDFPSETRFEDRRFDFAYRSMKPGLGLIWRPAANRRLWLETTGEWTRKHVTEFDPESPDTYRTTRDVMDARVEWLAPGPGAAQHRTGFRWVSLQEDNHQPHAPDPIGDLDHATHLLYSDWQWPVAARKAVRLGVYLNPVHHVVRGAGEPPTTRRESGFEGKIPCAFVHHGASHRVEFGVSMQLDEWAFGGGFVRGHMQF